MRPLYIFDLDGTIALIDHRRPILDDASLGPMAHRWRAFYEACDRDLPNMPVISTLRFLSLHGDVWVWSGRSSEVQDKTVRWLLDHVKGLNVALRMRDEGDFTHDVELKQMWLDLLEPRDRARLVAVFDDRNGVVDMWRRNGVACFQVAPGDF
jgi:hypothetical protein